VKPEIPFSVKISVGFVLDGVVNVHSVHRSGFDDAARLELPMMNVNASTSIDLMFMHLKCHKKLKAWLELHETEL
jgi:hypothetical protein